MQDPAAGTGGFLIAADRAIKERTDNLYDLTERERQFQRNHAFIGMELVTSTRRLALMNCLLHGMEGDDQGVVHLATPGQRRQQPAPQRRDAEQPALWHRTGGGGPTRRPDVCHQQQATGLLQHIVRHLKDGGRAAVVLPDNVLFEAGVGADVRRDLMDKCRLHPSSGCPPASSTPGRPNQRAVFEKK